MSPVGPLSFVLSQNLSKADTDKTQSFSFNIGTTHLMHFNKRTTYPLGETKKDKSNRVKELKFNILSAVNQENADILCIQEGFTEVIPKNYSHLKQVGKYEIKHGKIAGFNSSFLATYINPKKFRFQENIHFNQEYQSIHHRKGVGFPCRTQIFELTEISNGKRTILVNFHGVGSPDTSIRMILLEFLSNYLKKIYKEDDVVLVGDINTNLRREKGEKIELNFSKYVRDVLFNDFDVFPRDERKKSSYHRFIREPDDSFTDKPPSDRYDCLDYCFVKKHMGKEVSVKRIPKNFTNKEVPYKLNTDANIVLPNFKEFPSDHTLNIYTIKNRPGFIGLKPKVRIPRKQSKKGRSINNKNSVGKTRKKRKIKNSKSTY